MFRNKHAIESNRATVPAAGLWWATVLELGFWGAHILNMGKWIASGIRNVGFCTLILLKPGIWYIENPDPG